MPEGLKQEAERMGINVVNEKEGIIVADSPVETREFDSGYCNQKAIAILEQLEIIKSLADKENSRQDAEVQTAFTGARWSINAQFNYLNRTCHHKQEGADMLDMNMFRTMNLGGCKDFLEARCKRLAVDRLFLPIRDGGDGFISAMRTCEAAFRSSLAQSAHHMKLIYGNIISVQQ
jgi:hypothetical protein